LKPLVQPPLAAVALLLAAAVFAVSMAAQAPQGPQSEAGNPSSPPPPRTFPAPTNLKVLPKNLTGQQVHDIMKQWEASLGIQCGSCHAEDPDNTGPDGQPRLKFADDSKPMKSVARAMYTMTEEINSNYIAKLEGSGMPVSCGTCHRGHVSPDPFEAPLQQAQRPPISSQPIAEQPTPQ